MAIVIGQQAKAQDVHDLVRAASIQSWRRAGRYHHNIQARIDFTGNKTLTADRLYAVPFFQPKAMTLTKIVVGVDVLAAGKNARLGIYDDDGTIYPNDLVDDCGVVSVASTGTKEITGLSVALAGGLYWLAIISDGAPEMRSITLVDATMHWSPFGSSGINGYQGAQWQKDDTYGALPDPYPSAGSIEEGVTTRQIFFEVYLT